jgi:ABC-type nitrate/sulfonate/bicarbonate transport system substrate-binding protein
MKLNVRVLGAVLTALLVSSAASAQNLQLRISFASPFNTYTAPYLIAKSFGWFKEEGLEINDIIMNGDANATRALVTGASDVAMTGPLNVFNAVENGAQIKWIGSWQKSVDYVVAAPIRIKSLNDLADKTFASSGPSGLPQVLPVMLFKKLGVPSDKVRFVSVGGHSARLQAVLAGKADAAIVNEVTGLIGEKSGAAHVIVTVADHFPNLGYTVLAVKTADLADPNKRRAFEILQRQSIRGARFIVANPEKSGEILATYLKDLDVELITRVVKKLIAQNGWPANDGGLDDAVTNFTAKLEYDLGETKTLFQPEQVSDASIVKKVLAEERSR